MHILHQNLLLIVALFAAVDATRLRINRSEEPESIQVYQNYRTLSIADKNLYGLRRANALKGNEFKDVFFEDYRNRSGKFDPNLFEFDINDFLRKLSMVKWFVPLEERTALHVYDNPQDKVKATGPQVNQELCGIELDFIIYLIKNHQKSFQMSSDLSTARLLNSFDIPKRGLLRGSNIFPGDYFQCVENEIIISKKELRKMNKKVAQKYFANERLAPKLKLNMFQIIARYLGPFFGYRRDNMKLDLDDYRDNIRPVSTRYCLAALRWPNWFNTTFYKRNFNLRTAACLPETCDSNSLELHREKIKYLIDLNMPKFYNGYYIDELYCLPDEASELRNPFNHKSTIAFIIFNVVWLLLTFIGTMVKLFANKSEDGQRSKFFHCITCWSLTKNVSDFVNPRRGNLVDSKNEPKRKDVNSEPLEGFRFFAALLVITSHACLVGFASITWNPDIGHKLISSSWWAPVSIVCPAIVNVFFVLTGLITMKYLLESNREILFKFSFWFQFIVYRYIRIVPLYLFVHWFSQSSFRFLGSGPFWDYGTSHTAWQQVCMQESWWTIIIPRANFISPTVHCLSVGWYLANDIFFTILTPPIIILYALKPLLGHIFIISSLITAIILHIKYYLETTVDPRATFEWSIIGVTTVTDDNSIGYVHPQYRCVAYLIGLFSGYFYYRYEQGYIKEWPKAFVRGGKILLLVSCYLLVFLPYITTLFTLSEGPLIRWISAIFHGTVHGFFSVLTGIFILLLCTGKLPYIASFYGLKIFKPLANSALSVMLIHMPLLYYRSQTNTSLAEVSQYHFLVNNIVWCIESFVLAIFLHVVYELPMRRSLIKLLIELFSQRKTKKIDPEDEKNSKIVNTKKDN